MCLAWNVCTSSSDELAPSDPGPSFQAETMTPLHDQIALNTQLQECIKELEKEVAELKEYPRSLVRWSVLHMQSTMVPTPLTTFNISQ